MSQYRRGIAISTLNLDSLDDVLVDDGIPSFAGGQVSNQRANLIQPNESAQLINCDIGRVGKITTRRGTSQLGSGTAGIGSNVQGLSNFQTPLSNYLIAANGGLLWAYSAPDWLHIAVGGVRDNDVVTVLRLGAVNNGGGYPATTTTIVVDGFTGAVANGDTFRVAAEAGSPVHTISAHTESGGDTINLTFTPAIATGGIADNAVITLTKLGAINNAAGFDAGATTIAVDGFTGVVEVGDTFKIAGETSQPVHTVTARTIDGFTGNTISLDFTTPISSGFIGTDPAAQVQMTQGIDRLYFCDGIGNIFSWDGLYCADLGNRSLGDDTKPPLAPKALAWFTNRLIAAGMPNEPDAVYFSNYLDGAVWSRTFQQLRVGAGEGDPITGLVPWTDFNLIVLKQHSIWVVNCDPSQNQSGDSTQTVASFAVRLLHKLVGCPAPRSAVQTGGGGFNPSQSVYGAAASGSDVFLLTDSGVRSVRRTLSAETQQEVGEPLSYPVQDIIDRINPAAIHRSVATYRANRYLLAIPLDAATQPNYTLVYNTLTQSWSGLWSGWFPTSFAMRVPDVLSGVSRMCLGQSDGRVLEWLDYVPEPNETNATYRDAGEEIATSILTRAFTFNDLICPKTGLRMEVEFDFSTAQITIKSIAEAYTSASEFEGPFDSLSGILTLPLTLPFTLPMAGIVRKGFDLMRVGQFRELQFLISSESLKLSMRSISLSGWIDSLQIQSA